MKALWISLISSIVISVVYHLATSEFNIPFFYTIAVGLIIFALVFFSLSEIEI